MSACRDVDFLALSVPFPLVKFLIFTEKSQCVNLYFTSQRTMIKSKEAALVLFSGGQDSTTCLYWALKHFSQVHTLCISYGQRHAAEIEVARSIAQQEGIPFQVIDASFIGQIAVSALTSDMPMDKEKSADSYPNTFVPGRNMLFLTFAAVVAQGKGIRHIVTGVSEADYSGYPDCRDTFIMAANTSLNLAMDKQFKIHTPLMWLNKAEVWQLADELGAFSVVRNQTLTCYNGILADGCGQCPACTLRRQGLETYLTQRNK